MFGSNKKETGSPKSSSPASTGGTHSLNSLVQGTLVEGTVRSESDIRIDGSIRGKLFCDAKVIIGPTGHVSGEIRCKNAVVEGKFEGSFEVAELLNIRENANVSGEISTNKLIVQSGAIFNVSCSMGGDGKKKPAASAVSQNGKESSIDTNQVAKAKPAGV